MQQQLHFLKSYLTVRFDFVLPFLQTDLPAAAPIALDFIRSYPFAILFEAFPLTTDNFDRTVRQLGKDSVSAFPSFGQKVVIQLSCNTLLSYLRYRQIILSQFSTSAYPSCLTGPSQGVRDVSEKATIISLARLSRF